ncbi:MAG: Rrf2 family transcriptional regulator [Pseudomonadota bacterium]
MRLTARTDLAMRVLMFCAANPDRTVKKSEIAACCNASENHLGVIISRLGQTGYLATTRGRHGGMRLGKAPNEISVGEIFRMFEEGLPFTECYSSTGNNCPIITVCKLRPAIDRALAAFFRELDGVTLQDLCAQTAPLQKILGLSEVFACEGVATA